MERAQLHSFLCFHPLCTVAQSKRLNIRFGYAQKRRDKLEFWFANHEYTRLFQLQNACVADHSELARVL